MKADSQRESYTNDASSLMLPASLYQKGIENMAEGISSSIKGALDMDQAALSGYTMLKSMSEFLTPTIEGITHLYPNIDLIKRTADIMPTSAIVSQSFANLLKTLGDNADVASRLQLNATKSLGLAQISKALAKYDFRINVAFQKDLADAVGVESAGNGIDKAMSGRREQNADKGNKINNSIRFQRSNYRLVKLKHSENPANSPQDTSAEKESIRINHDNFIRTIDHFSHHPLITAVGVAAIIADSMERFGFDPHSVNSYFMTTIITLMIFYYSSSKKDTHVHQN